MGANTFNIQRYEFNNQRSNDREKVNPVIDYRNVKTFVEDYNFPFTKTSVSLVGTSAAEVRYENDKTDPEVQVYGVNENYITNSGLEVELGRSLNYFDVENSNSVCVIGSDLRKALLEDVNPINKTISIRGAKFKVIGVLKEKGATFGNNQDLRVLMPLQKARTIFTNANINYNLSVKTEVNKDMLEKHFGGGPYYFRTSRTHTIEAVDFGWNDDDLSDRIATFPASSLPHASIVTSLQFSVAVVAS